MADINNTVAERYRENKSVDELSDDVLIELGKVFAKNILVWATDEDYEPWEFSSEELPQIVQEGLDVGLIKKRQSHVETNWKNNI